MYLGDFELKNKFSWFCQFGLLFLRFQIYNRNMLHISTLCECTLLSFQSKIFIFSWDTAWCLLLTKIPLNNLRRSYHRGRFLCRTGNSVFSTSDIRSLFNRQRRRQTCSQVSDTIRRLAAVLMHLSAVTKETCLIKTARGYSFKCHPSRLDVDS